MKKYVMTLTTFLNEANTCYINFTIHILTSLSFISISIITIHIKELYSKSKIMEENYEAKKMLLVVESLHQVMCDIVFGYRY